MLTVLFNFNNKEPGLTKGPDLANVLDLNPNFDLVVILQHFHHGTTANPEILIQCRDFFCRPDNPVMLSNLAKEHSNRCAARRQQQERRRQEACQAAAQLTSALVDHLNVGVAQAYLNQKRLDAEAKRLHSHAAEFSSQTKKWLNLVDDFDQKLKELGDAASWAATVEKDAAVIASALEYAHKVNCSGEAAAEADKQQQ